MPCPPMPQFLELAGMRGCFDTSPLSGQVVFLCPGSLQMLQNLVRLLIPSYGTFSLLEHGRSTQRFLLGADSPVRASQLLEAVKLFALSTISPSTLMITHADPMILRFDSAACLS